MGVDYNNPPTVRGGMVIFRKDPLTFVNLWDRFPASSFSLKS